MWNKNEVGEDMKKLLLSILALILVLSLVACSQQTAANNQDSTTTENTDENVVDQTTASPTPQPTIQIGTRKNPVPLGDSLIGSLQIAGSPLCNFEMSITSTTRGKEAWTIIEDANMFNDEPTDDHEYILVKVRVKNLQDLSGADDSLDINKYDFDLATSSDSISDNQPSIVLPSPELDFKLYEGSEDEGYIAFMVEKSDKNPKAVFVDNFWFLLQ